MANPEQLDILKQGVEVWNEWRTENRKAAGNANNQRVNQLVDVDLNEANLIEANLSGADLSDAELLESDLSGADLSGANLSNSVLWEAQLEDANLERSSLIATQLEGANLASANLNGADLYSANLYNVNLRGAQLVEAELDSAELPYADLSHAKLSKASLRAANFYRAKLFNTDLREADLRGAVFLETDVKKTNLRKADLDEVNLRKAILETTDLSKANLSHAIMVETKLERVILTGCRVYGTSVWDVKLTETIQKDLVITRENEPMVMVDDLEVAQFVYLLLHHGKLRNVLNAVTEKGILMLGRFGGGGIEVLRAVGEQLRELSYIPIIFDFERPRELNYTETIKTLVGMARFVIVDLSGPSVPQELHATVPHFKLPFVPILEAGRREYSMFADLLEYQNVLEPVEFHDQDQLLEILSERIIAPAEELVVDRQEKLAELFGRKSS